MAWMAAICPITDEQALVNSETVGDIREFRCPSCGDFKSRTRPPRCSKAYRQKLERFEYARAIAGDNAITVTTEHGSIDPEDQ